MSAPHANPFAHPAHRPRTPPEPVIDRETLRPFLDAEPVRLAILSDRVYQQRNYREVFVEGDPPRGVLALSRPRTPGRPAGFALHAQDAALSEALVALLPAGPVFFHLTDEGPVDAIVARAEESDPRPAWLYALDPEDFRDLSVHPSRPVGPEWASRIATLWDPTWPSEAYVRARIEGGPTRGIYADGDLVAWALTHVVTDRVAVLGFFHVVDEHRRKGFGASAASALAKDVLASGKTPALHVFEDNEPSIRLVERLGFRRVVRQVWGDAILR